MITRARTIITFRPKAGVLPHDVTAFAAVVIILEYIVTISVVFMRLET